MTLASRFNLTVPPSYPTYGCITHYNSNVSNRYGDYYTPFRPTTIEDVAELMEARNNNVGFTIGRILRAGYDEIAHGVLKLIRWVAGSSDTEENIRSFEHPEYSELSQEAQLCMLMNPHKDTKYPQNINLFVNLSGTEQRLMTNAFMNMAAQYAEYANLRFSFLSPENKDKADIFIGFLKEDLIGKIRGHAHSPESIATYGEPKQYQPIIEIAPHLLNFGQELSLDHVILHEMGHAFFDARHPFESHLENSLSSVELSDFLDRPELTRMTYTNIGVSVAFSKTLRYHIGLGTQKIHQNIPYCDTVMAIEKYGQNLNSINQLVHHSLTENTGHAYTLSNKGGVGVFDGRSLTARADFVLGAGFEPTRIDGTFYYLGHRSDVKIVYTSRFDDSIRLGNIMHQIYITEGKGKILIVQPNALGGEVYGFRVTHDAIHVQGFPNLYSIEDIAIQSLDQNSIFLRFGEETCMRLKNVNIDDVADMKIKIERQKQDGIAYIYQLNHRQYILMNISTFGFGMTVATSIIAALKSYLDYREKKSLLCEPKEENARLRLQRDEIIKTAILERPKAILQDYSHQLRKASAQDSDSVEQLCKKMTTLKI